jgi:chloramphenicol 3-O-phosphotransferase
VVTTCRLRAGADELRRRLVARRADDAFIDAALAEAEVLDAGTTGDLCIDTSGRSIEEVVALVRQRTAGWADRTPAVAPTTEDGGPIPAGGPILWVCGPTGVGKSTAGFDVFLRHVLNAGIAGAFVDLDQIGFYRPAAAAGGIDHAMRAGILAEMWRTFRAAGAECLTVVGPAGNAAAITAYARALPAATFTVCRLHASAEELARRIARRGDGHGSWAQPGDPLVGRTAGYLSAVAARAAADAEALDRAAVGDVRIDTDRLTAEEVADAIVAATGWPATGRPRRV